MDCNHAFLIPSQGGTDFVPTTVSLSFEPGATEAVVGVTILDDATEEPNEQFTARLSTLVEGDITVTPSTATVLILDDDSKFTINHCDVINRTDSVTSD